MWSRLALVAFGGALGAVLRYLASNWAHRCTQAVATSMGNTPWAGFVASFPWGTWLVNVVGSGFLGLLLAWSLGESAWLPEPYRLFLAVGVCGALTTFSTFSAETLTALQAGAVRLALANVVLSVVIGLAACAVGWQLGQRWVA